MCKFLYKIQLYGEDVGLVVHCAPVLLKAVAHPDALPVMVPSVVGGNPDVGSHMGVETGERGVNGTPLNSWQEASTKRDG